MCALPTCSFWIAEWLKLKFSPQNMQNVSAEFYNRHSNIFILPSEEPDRIMGRVGWKTTALTSFECICSDCTQDFVCNKKKAYGIEVSVCEYTGEYRQVIQLYFDKCIYQSFPCIDGNEVLSFGCWVYWRRGKEDIFSKCWWTQLAKNIYHSLNLVSRMS